MRILHIGKYFPPYSGGIENFQCDLMGACVALGHPAAAVVHNHRFADATRRERFFVSSAEPMEVVRAASYGRILFAPVSPTFALTLRRMLREFRPDVLHVHMPNPSAFWLLLPHFNDVPIVLHWHADVVGGTTQRALAAAYQAYRPLEQALLRRADTVIVTSQPYLEASAALSNWRGKCRVIPLGMDPDRLVVDEPVDDSASWNQGNALKLLMVGRLSAYKGHKELISAVHQIPGTELLIVGSGEQRGHIQRAIHDGPRADAVHLLGHLSSGVRNRLIVGSDLACLPSTNRAEAFGLAAVEAMALGRPVLVSDLPGSGLSTLIEAGVSGLQSIPGDVASLQSQLLFARDHRDFLAKMGHAARQRFLENFHIRSVVESTIAVYEDVVGSPRRPLGP